MDIIFVGNFRQNYMAEEEEEKSLWLQPCMGDYGMITVFDFLIIFCLITDYASNSHGHHVENITLRRRPKVPFA